MLALAPLRGSADTLPLKYAAFLLGLHPGTDKSIWN